MSRINTGLACEQAVDLLLAHGVDINAKTADGKTPLDLFLEREDSDMAEWLIQRGAKTALQLE